MARHKHHLLERFATLKGSKDVLEQRAQRLGLAGIEEWDPDDLTVTVGAGTKVADLEATLSERSQTAVLPEVPGASTVGGVISAGVSALRRARLLGTRERMLEVRLVTGDGRIVRGGGRVVKNVSGYDLPRLVVGAFGSLGVITSTFWYMAAGSGWIGAGSRMTLTPSCFASSIATITLSNGTSSWISNADAPCNAEPSRVRSSSLKALFAPGMITILVSALSSTVTRDGSRLSRWR